MGKLLIILIALFGVFLATGCTDNQGGNQTGTPVQAVTEVVTETPVTEVTPAVGVTGAMNQTGQNITGIAQQATHQSRESQRRMTEAARMTEGQSSAGNNTSSGGAVRVTPGTGY